MPTTVPNGLVVYNLTPHPLYFLTKYTDEVVVADSDGVLDAMAWVNRVESKGTHELITIDWKPTRQGEWLIKEIREENPEAIILGSIIAARAYRGIVYAPVNLQASRLARLNNTDRFIRYDRFTIFQKETENNGY